MMSVAASAVRSVRRAVIVTASLAPPKSEWSETSTSPEKTPIRLTDVRSGPESVRCDCCWRSL